MNRYELRLEYATGASHTHFLNCVEAFEAQEEARRLLDQDPAILAIHVHGDARPLFSVMRG